MDPYEFLFYIMHPRKFFSRFRYWSGHDNDGKTWIRIQVQNSVPRIYPSSFEKRSYAKINKKEKSYERPESIDEGLIFVMGFWATNKDSNCKLICLEPACLGQLDGPNPRSKLIPSRLHPCRGNFHVEKYGIWLKTCNLMAVTVSSFLTVSYLPRPFLNTFYEEWKETSFVFNLIWTGYF